MKKLYIAIFCAFLLIPAVSFSHAAETSIRILYFNDFHGFAEPHKPAHSDKMLGGAQYLAEKAERLRNEKPSLLLVTGDMIYGNHWSNQSKGASVIELLNTMKIDAMAAGNHEFDFGSETFRQRISEANFPILGASVEGMPELRPYVIKELNGIKIALIGVITQYTPDATKPENIVGLRFTSPLYTLIDYIDELRSKADFVIVLSHAGYNTDRTIARRVRWIDLIVGGHTHTRLDKPVVVNKTIIVQAWEHAKALGVLDLTINNGKVIKFKGYLEDIKPVAGKENKAVRKIIDKYK